MKARLPLSLLAAGGLAVLAVAAAPWPRVSAQETRPYADADDAGMVAAGRAVYAGNCAQCHGRRLQGQPLWQLADEYAGRRAPAHDATGHTWQHSDEELFSMTKYGRFPGEPAGSASAMPAFDQRLRDRDILAVLAFIKARWPLGMRAAQAMLNPGFAGMPSNADGRDWRFPPICSATIRREISADPAPENRKVATGAPAPAD